MWKDIGIRTRVWVPKMGHAMPPTATLAEAVKWLDDDVSRRASAAKKSPNSRAIPDGALTQEENAKALFDEAETTPR